MTDVTQILSQLEEGDPSAAEELLPLVYEELRKLAAKRMAQVAAAQRPFLGRSGKTKLSRPFG